MAIILKASKSQSERQDDDAKVRSIVEGLLADIENNGDKAVRALSEKFDNWSPESFVLSQADIEAGY